MLEHARNCRGVSEVCVDGAGTIAGIVIKTRLQPAWMLEVWGTPFPPAILKNPLYIKGFFLSGMPNTGWPFVAARRQIGCLKSFSTQLTLVMPR